MTRDALILAPLAQALGTRDEVARLQALELVEIALVEQHNQRTPAQREQWLAQAS